MRSKLPILLSVFLLGILAGALVAGAFLQGPADRTGATPASPSTAGVESVPAGPETTSESETTRVAAAVAELGRDQSGADERSREVSDTGLIAPPSPGALDELERLKVRWARIESELSGLRERIAGLERRLASVPRDGNVSAEDTPRARTPEDRREALRAAGVADDVASEIIWLQGQSELTRLELRDRAIREGWFGTQRYRDELSGIGDERPSLREELGDVVYDRYLFAAGEENRVRIQGVIAGSVAEEAGFDPGDSIETYDGKRVFTFAELRSATAEGERDEMVPMEIRRADGSVVQFWVPRGPLGVRLDLTRSDPEG